MISINGYAICIYITLSVIVFKFNILFYYYNIYPQILDPLSIPERRETSHRKAKSRSIAQTFFKDKDPNELEEPPDFVDSDSDPAWTPNADKV